jgi:hypothetical protein
MENLSSHSTLTKRAANLENERSTSPHLLHSRKDAAAILGISIRAIDYLIATQQLGTRKIGSRRLIPDSELIRFSKRDHPNPIVPRKRCRVSGAPSQPKHKDGVTDKPQSRGEGEKL